MEKKSMTQEVIKNSVWSIFLQVFGRFSGLIFTILLARVLLPEKFGVYSLVLSVATLFMAFGDLGLNQTLTVFFSKNLKNPEKSNSYFNFLFKIKLILAFASSILLFVLSYFLANYIFSAPKLTTLFMASALYIFFFSLASFFSSFFYIYLKVKLDFFKEVLFQAVRFSVIIIFFLLIPSEYNLAGVFTALIISSFAMSVYTIIFSKKLAPFIFTKLTSKLDKHAKLKVLKFLSYLAIGSISLIIFSEIDIFMLGLLVKDLIFVGYYRAYFTLVLGVTALISFGYVLLPVFSSFKNSRFAIASDKVKRFLFLINLPATFGFLILARYFVKFFFGADYLAGSLILYFLTFLIFSESTTNLLTSLFWSKQEPKLLLKPMIIATFLNIMLNYFLITLLMPISLVWATAGAAIATLISRYFFMFYLVYLSYSNFNLSIKKEFVIKPLISSLIMAFVIFYAVSRLDMNLILGALFVILGALIYFITLLLIKGINKTDIKPFVNILQRKL